METPSKADLALLAWDQSFFNGGPVKRRVRKGLTGFVLTPAGRQRNSATGGREVKHIRSRLEAIVNCKPQVMVKVSGGGKTIRHIKAHFDYISRNGQIPLEDQDGEKMVGAEAPGQLRDEWQFGGFPILDDDRWRQAFNVVLSMPAGTSEVGLVRAAREFAHDEFAGHQYVMALHTYETDPDTDPSPNPHVHLCIKATGDDGSRLNPRKADLQRWRQRFAERLQENGIECDATSRLTRLQPSRGVKQGVRHKLSRGESLLKMEVEPSRTRVERARQLEEGVVQMYRRLASALATSADTDDRKLAIGVARRFANPRMNKDQAGRTDRDR